MIKALFLLLPFCCACVHVVLVRDSKLSFIVKRFYELSDFNSVNKCCLLYRFLDACVIRYAQIWFLCISHVFFEICIKLLWNCVLCT